MWPASRTAQGPAAHLGLNRHDSSQLWLLGMPLRSEAPWTIFTPTVHRPCRRAAETGGREVATTRTGDRAERCPPRTAATRNWYAVAGSRPVPRYDVTDPGTEPTTLPSSRITYLSGSGPVAGPAQRNATDLVVEGPATSPVGRSSGGLFHGAQITRPAIKPSTATAAIATRGITHLRRRRSVAAGPLGPADPAAGSGPTESAAASAELAAGPAELAAASAELAAGPAELAAASAESAASTGPAEPATSAGLAESVAGAGSGVRCADGGGPRGSTVVTPPSDTSGFQSVPSQKRYSCRPAGSVYQPAGTIGGVAMTHSSVPQPAWDTAPAPGHMSGKGRQLPPCRLRQTARPPRRPTADINKIAPPIKARQYWSERHWHDGILASWP